MTLTEFLLARIAEDEENASFGLAHPYDTRDGSGSFDPARVLAECEAKRRIVELAIEEFADAPFAPYGGGEAVAREVLQALASVYSDHADYGHGAIEQRDAARACPSCDRDLSYPGAPGHVCYQGGGPQVPREVRTMSDTSRRENANYEAWKP